MGGDTVSGKLTEFAAYKRARRALLLVNSVNWFKVREVMMKTRHEWHVADSEPRCPTVQQLREEAFGHVWCLLRYRKLTYSTSGGVWAIRMPGDCIVVGYGVSMMIEEKEGEE